MSCIFNMVSFFFCFFNTFGLIPMWKTKVTNSKTNFLRLNNFQELTSYRLVVRDLKKIVEKF